MDDDPLDDARPAGPPPWDLDASPVGRVLAPSAPPPAEGVDWAELPLRAGALLIDLAIISVVTDLIGRAVNWVWTMIVFPTFTDPYTPVETGTRFWHAALLIAPNLLMWVLVGAAAMYLWTVYRASPGQMALGLFTVDTEGRPLQRGPATMRFLVLAIPWILTGGTNILLQVTQLFEPEASQLWREPLYAVFAVLPLLWFAVLSLTMLRDARGRGWQDRVAGSVVVRRSGPPS
jgi:uncharacterized RDD family membrane protein YckC